MQIRVKRQLMSYDLALHRYNRRVPDLFLLATFAGWVNCNQVPQTPKSRTWGNATGSVRHFWTISHRLQPRPDHQVAAAEFELATCRGLAPLSENMSDTATEDLAWSSSASYPIRPLATPSVHRFATI